jgi:hypothetical protein
MSLQNVHRSASTSLHTHSCPRTYHDMSNGLRGEKEQVSARCAEPARCTVSCKLSVVTRLPPETDINYGSVIPPLNPCILSLAMKPNPSAME